MSERPVDLLGLTKSTLWEEAKGKLRAIVAAEGQRTDHYPRDGVSDQRFSYEIISEEIENFIKFFESEEHNL